MTYKAIDSNTGELKFYGTISEWWNGAEEFTRVFEEMEGKFKNINIRMHCYGGQVLEGSVIFNVIAKSKANVTVYIDGLAASMASIVILAAKKVVMAENAFIMIHNPSGYTEGNADAHFVTAKLLKSMEKNFAKAYARKTGKQESEVSKLFDGHDHWYSAEDAKAFGLIDEIATPIVSNIKQLDVNDNANPESVYNRFAALLNDSTTASLNPNNITMKKQLITLFALSGVTENSTDEEVLDAISQEFKTAKAAATQQANAHIESIIATAEERSGTKFDEVKRNSFKAIGEKAGIDVLQSALSLVPSNSATPNSTPTPAPRIIDMVGGKTSANDDTAGWNWNDYQTKKPQALEALRKNDPEKFKTLFKAEYGVDPE